MGFWLKLWCLYDDNIIEEVKFYLDFLVDK